MTTTSSRAAFWAGKAARHGSRAPRKARRDKGWTFSIDRKGPAGQDVRRGLEGAREGGLGELAPVGKWCVHVNNFFLVPCLSRRENFRRG